MTVELERQKDREHEERAIKTFCAKYGRFWEKIGGKWQPDFLLYKEDKKLHPEAKPTAIVEVKGIRDTKGSEHPYPSFIVANRKLMTVDAYIKANPAIEQAFDDRAMSLIIIWAFSDVLCWAEWMKLEGSLKWIERKKKRESGESGENDKEFVLSYDKRINNCYIFNHWIPMI